MTTPEIIDPGLIAAMRKFSDIESRVRYDAGKPTASEMVYVHTYDDHTRRMFTLGTTLSRLADLLEQNDIDFLKMRHLRKVGGDLIDEMLKARR